MKKLKYISLFAGIGGFDLALNRLGHVCVWANEWDKYAAQIYNKNFIRPLQQEDTERPKERQLTKNQPHQREHLGNGVDTRDITTVLTSEIPDHDLLVGGFPCQSFSIAGKRRGFDDTRGTLFFEIARILKDKQPKYFILENVKGLLSHDNGNTFKTIIATLTELGYDIQWQVLNSKNYGVPQNRERVFIVGHIRGERRPEVFPITEVSGKTVSKTILDINQAQRVYDIEGVAITQKALGGGQGAKTGLYAIDMTRRENTGYRVREDKIALTLDANYYKGLANQERPGVLDNMKIRRLTPTECERLQGFPDGWTEGISDTQRYKCLGNAVTVNVITAIAERLI